MRRKWRREDWSEKEMKETCGTGRETCYVRTIKGRYEKKASQSRRKGEERAKEEG